jgi:vitamin B12 transporter
LFFNLSTFATENVTLTSYALMDVYLEYAIWKDNLKLWVDVKNLLDQNYQEVYGYNTQGLNFMTGLNFKF